ncbi:cupin domain-containing protein [Glutamicibacter sp. X7]
MRPAATAHNALDLPLTHHRVEPPQCLGEEPTTTALYELPDAPAGAAGLWEMSVGTMQDVEDDEYFLVIAGTATLKVLASNGFAAQELALVPGSLIRLHAGMHTHWQVHSTLRKLYLSR